MAWKHALRFPTRSKEKEKLYFRYRYIQIAGIQLQKMKKNRKHSLWKYYSDILKKVKIVKGLFFILSETFVRYF